MRVLVTGTSGFVGGAIGRYLRRQGMHVTGMSRTAPRAGAADVAIAHDLTRPLPAHPALARPFDAVVHAAALSAPWGRPDAFARANVDGTAHVLALAERTGHFILISSSSVLYDVGDQFDLPETPAPATPPVNAYAATKRQAEALVRAAPCQWAIIRPRAVFGTGDTVLFPRIARAARLRLLPRLIRPDGARARGDLVSIDTLVRCLHRIVTGRATDILHLTDGAPVEIEGFVADALARVGLPPPAWPLGTDRAMVLAGALEALSRRTGWWEPPLTRFGIGVFSASKTFDTTRARAAIGPPDIPTGVALDRFAAWWRAGAALDDPAMSRVGDTP